jgi:hypothetical protein
MHIHRSIAIGMIRIQVAQSTRTLREDYYATASNSATTSCRSRVGRTLS